LELNKFALILLGALAGLIFGYATSTGKGLTAWLLGSSVDALVWTIIGAVAALAVVLLRRH
jgi:hypothetical protein